MKALGLKFHWCLLLLLSLVAVGLTSCATTEDSDNASARPWNAPKGWETGMPTGMMDRQR